MHNVIQVKNLYHSYGKHVVFKNLNFTVKKGTICGLFAKNGTGKTTLINILMGFLHPTSGTCLVLGEDSRNLSPQTRRKIGLLHEGHLAYEFMTIEQAEKFYSVYYPQWNQKRYYELIDMMGVSYSHKISKLSCGQRSQVVLALILAQNPELMILDDYAMGLDAGYRKLFLDYLIEYAKDGEKTVFLTSHIVQDLEKLVDDVIFIRKDGYVLHGSLIEFMSSFKQYRFKINKGMKMPKKDEIIKNVEIMRDNVFLYTFESKESIKRYLIKKGIEVGKLEEIPMTLEDAFIGLMGKY